MSTPEPEADEWDVYASELAAGQLERDALDDRRSLYTNTKPDHPSGCQCEQGDWSHGFSPGGPLRGEYDPCGAVPLAPELEAG